MPKTECGFADQGELVMFGPTLWVEIGFDSRFRPDKVGRPDLPQDALPALVDTGAASSCIDSALAAHLRLPIVNREHMSGAHGSGELNMHLAQIWVPSLRQTTWGSFAGVHLLAGGQRHVALIGRTFLQNFRMVYDGKTGAVTLHS